MRQYIRSRGDRLLRARVNALLCAGKVSASRQVEGAPLSGSNYPITWRPTICWKVGEIDRGSAATAAAVAAAARDGRRGPKRTGQRAP